MDLKQRVCGNGLQERLHVRKGQDASMPEPTANLEHAAHAAAQCEIRMASQCADLEDVYLNPTSMNSLPAGNLHELWERLHNACLQAGLQSAEAKSSVGLAVSSLSQRLDALESAGLDTMRRLSEAEAVINAKASGLSELVDVVARCDSRLSEVEVLQAQLAQEIVRETSSRAICRQASTGQTSCISKDDELGSLGVSVERSLAVQNKILTMLRKSASKAGTESEQVAELTQQSARIHHAVEGTAAAFSVQRLETSTPSRAVPTSELGTDAGKHPHMHGPACADDSGTAQAEMKDANNWEKAVFWAKSNATDAEAPAGPAIGTALGATRSLHPSLQQSWSSIENGNAQRRALSSSSPATSSRLSVATVPE